MPNKTERSFLGRLIRDPISHFIVLGFGLFVLFGFANDGALRDPQGTIIVTEDKLATWLQFRNKAFSPAAANTYLNTMPKDKRDELIDEYIKDEALYRRALTLGLDANDAVIRQRLIQKMDYVALGMTGLPQKPQVPEQVLRDWFAERSDDYLAAAWVTLTHIFFENESDAAAAYAAIKDGADAPKGERFLFRRNYVEATQALINDHLGEAIGSHAFGAGTQVNEWSAPLQSPYGWHLVKLLDHQPETLPPFEELAPQLLQDWYREQQGKARDIAISAIVDTFTIKIEFEQVNRANQANQVDQHNQENGE